MLGSRDVGTIELQYTSASSAAAGLVRAERLVVGDAGERLVVGVVRVCARVR